MLDWPQIIQAIGTAAVAIIGALALLYAKRAAEAPPAVLVPPPAALALLERVPVGVGGGLGGHASEIAATVLPWFPSSYIPAYNQNKGTLPDGNQDAEHWNDCGETCVSMIIAGVWGCPVEPGSIRQYLTGAAGSGLTDGNALVRALKQWSVKAHMEPIGGGAAWDAITASVETQRCVIMLGHWEGAGTYLHWVVCVGNGNEQLAYVDPWDGTRGTMTRANWAALEATQLVILDSHIHFDCRTWSDPT